MQVTDEMVKVAAEALVRAHHGADAKESFGDHYDELVGSYSTDAGIALTAALAAMQDHFDRQGYDPHGPEVRALHYWFADNGQQWKWHDDGCRSEQARGLLNHLAKAGMIVVPAPSQLSKRDDAERDSRQEA